jgi:hypothetical protein
MILALCPISFAYTTKTTDAGDVVRWAAFPAEWTWSGQGPQRVPDAEERLADAFGRWAAVPGAAISFREAPGAVPHPSEAPDAVNVIWSTDDWPFDPDLLALTCSWTTEDGTIVAFDIRVNGNVEWGDVDGDEREDRGSEHDDEDEDLPYDFRAALTHEVGHVLGLDHSAREDATMFATMGRGEAWRADLGAADEDGARFLYPSSASAEAPSSPLPLSCSLAPVGAGSLVPTLLAGASLLRRRGGSDARSVDRRRFRLDVRPHPGPGRAGRALQRGRGGGGD